MRAALVVMALVVAGGLAAGDGRERRGTAEAVVAGDGDQPRGGAWAVVAGIAERLGLAPPAATPPALDDALARELRVPASRVDAALDAVRADARDAFAVALARAAGTPARRVGWALAAAREDRRGRWGSGFRGLAREIGARPARLRAAFAHVARAYAPHPAPSRRPLPGASALAARLGLPEAAVDAALARLAPAQRAGWDARRLSFADELAQRLRVDPGRTRGVVDELLARAAA